MKAQSLRIGNLIWSNDGHFDRVEDFVTEIESNRIGTKCSKLPYIPIENIEPIPLTEEWLVKFGFVRRTPTGYYFDMGRMSINIPDFEYKNIRIDVKLQYIHQLQNLYFAITGTELTLTEKPTE